MNIIIPGSGHLFGKNDVKFSKHLLNIINKQFADLFIPGPSYHMEGRVGYDILDAATGIVLKHVSPKGNMILNCGKDMACSHKFADCFLYGHLSTNTATPTATDTTMAGWVKQSNTYSSGDCGSTFADGVFTMTRAFVFTAETGDVTYTKFYSSYASGSGSTPFNEILFASPITLASGQQVRITMSLAITLSPYTTPITYSTDVISGVTGSTGSFRIVAVAYSGSVYNSFISNVNSSGATGGSAFILDLGASYTADKFYASTVSTLYGPLGTSAASIESTKIGTEADNMTKPTYVSGSYAITRTYLADLAYCNGKNIRSLFINYYYCSQSCLQFLSDVSFTKLNTQKLSLNVAFTLV